MSEPGAVPTYAIGSSVQYVDHHKRPQIGKVLSIEASWREWAKEPLIIYTVAHPTYRNRLMYVAENNIVGGRGIAEGLEKGLHRIHAAKVAG